MSFTVYKLYWKPLNRDNEGHVAFYVETDQVEATRMANGKRVTELVQTGHVYHATDLKHKIVKDGSAEFVQFEFERKPFTPCKSLTVSEMFEIGKLEVGKVSTLPTIARSVSQPRRPFPYTSRNKRPNCVTWYMDFIKELSDGNVVSFSGEEVPVDRFKPRKIVSASASGSSSASGHKERLRNLFKKK